MKTTSLLAHVIALISVSLSTQAQGTFQNLDFEQARIVPDPASPLYPTAVAVTNAVPGWTVYVGAFYPYDILYDTVSLGAAAVSIHDTNDFGMQVLQGRYTLLLQTSFPDGQQLPSIGQVGLIPSDAQSIRFYALGTISVTANGQPVLTMPISTEPDYTVYGGDISAFVGQTVDLRFRCDLYSAALDNIFFSTLPIPEPGVLGLSVLGGLVLWRRRLRVTR